MPGTSAHPALLSSKPLEVGAAEFLIAGGVSVVVVEVTAVDGVVATVLHAEQFVDTFVELVVADAGEVEAHRVERLDRWLVVEQTREERGAADEVAGSDRERCVGGGCVAQFGELGGQVLAAAGGGTAEAAIDRARRTGLDVAVVVVERQDLDRGVAGSCAGQGDERSTPRDAGSGGLGDLHG